MGIRRTHHKSRNGCVTCKKRHVKCDERKPICSNCSGRLLTCAYPSNTFRNANKVYSTASPASSTLAEEGAAHSSSARPQSPDTQQQESQRFSLEDLELFHYYTLHTSVSIAIRSDHLRIWQDEMPKLATKHYLLAQGLLSLAALHKSSQQPDEDVRTIEHLVKKAAFHQNAGISLFRREVQNCTPENCDALFAFSMIINIVGWSISVQEQRAFGKPKPAEGVQRFSEWVRITRGMSVVLQPTWDWAIRGPLGEVVQRGQMENEQSHFGPMTPTQKAEDARLAALQVIWDPAPPEYTCDADGSCGGVKESRGASHQPTIKVTFDEASSLDKALTMLRKSYVRLALAYDDPKNATSNTQVPNSSGESLVTTSRPAAVIAFLFNIDENFLGMLERRHPAPLVLIAHFAVLLWRVRDYWWMYSVGEALANSAEVLLDERYQPSIEWPLNQVGSSG